MSKRKYTHVQELEGEILAMRKEYPRITLESTLYRGAWLPPGASRQTFLINRNGRLNGDISAAGLAQDRLPSRTPASNCPGVSA